MSGDYLAGLRIRIEPGPGAVASLRGVLLVVPSIEPGQEEALDALLAAATVRPVVRAVARVVADFDRDRLPAFCLVVEGEDDAPFALVHGPVVLTARGGGGEVRLDGLESRFWVDHALPTVLEHLAVHAVGGGEEASTDRLVLEATAAAGLVERSPGDTPEENTPVASVPVADGGFGSGAPAAEPVAVPAIEPVAEPVAVRVPETVPDATSVLAAVPATDAPDDADATDDDAETDDAATDDVEAEINDTGTDDAEDVADDDAEHDADVSAERGRAVMAAPAVAAAGGSSSVGFRAEPIRFGQGGRMESVAPPTPPVTVNGWHEESLVPAAAPSAVDEADRTPEGATSGPRPAEAAPEAAVEVEAVPEAEVVPEPAVPEPAASAATTSSTASTPSTGAPSAPAGGSPFAAPAGSPFAGPARTPFAVPADSPFAAPADSPFAAPADRREPEAPGLPVRRPQTSIPPQAATQLVAPPAPGQFPGAVPPPVQPGFDPFAAAAPRPPEQDLLREPGADHRAGGERPGGGRPRRGRLVMENGPDVVVDSDCVIGRNPEVDPDVAQGRAKPVVLPDAEQRISRVHARLVFTDGGVEIVDAGSVNGTWIEPPGGAGWIAMVARVPAPLPLGSRIQVGDLVLSYSPVDDDA